MRILSLNLLIALFIEAVTSHKILVYNSQYGHSHSNFLGNIADILVDAGHDVTSFIPIIDPEVKDGTSKSKKVFVPQAKDTKDLLDKMMERKADFFSMSNFDPIITFIMNKVFASQFLYQCRAVLEEPEILKKFQAEKFDVMIVENFDMCGVAYSHLVKPKSLITSSGSSPFSFMFEEFGIPLSLSYNPSSYMTSLDVHSMFDRAKNIYAEFLMHALFYPGRWMIDGLYQEKFGAEYPSVQEISSHAAYTFTNSEPLIDFAAPTLNRVIPIGGIGAKPPKPLNEYWNEVLSRRSKNILLSFGSVAKSVYLADDIKQSILTTVGSFPEITFIWKYEHPEDEFGTAASSALPNLVLSSWMPQNDILNDERITLFITHGGMGSTQETALRGKPGIFIPIFGDQMRNAGMMQHNGLGKVIDKFDLHKPEVVIAAVKDVLSNDSYRKNAARVGKMLAKKPFSSKEQLIKTIAFAAEYGPSRALRPQSYDMTFVEYHNLDIIAVFVVLALFSLYLTKKVVCCLLTKCFGFKCCKKDEKKAKKE
ncbi:hypothetical protein PENTCL1PPCAC_8122 [Pristionchus entomophagus]|uniref:glucuronosyltransferase n=1 Tax=Pristionchus entomophagus TaxID=358040 RepID=A0AAV5SRE7_9BILA|nr:hypothetical protein PENTCL1PPCAC_8122 [Pristionchus entomophagus]